MRTILTLILASVAIFSVAQIGTVHTKQSENWPKQITIQAEINLQPTPIALTMTHDICGDSWGEIRSRTDDTQLDIYPKSIAITWGSNDAFYNQTFYTMTKEDAKATAKALSDAWIDN